MKLFVLKHPKPFKNPSYIDKNPIKSIKASIDLQVELWVHELGDSGVGLPYQDPPSAP